MRIIVTHASAFDFKTKLYQPLRESELNTQHEIYLPQENGKEQMTKEMIENADLILAEVSLPSTGQGIELGWAHAAGVPILCLHERGAKFSNSLRFITNLFIEYADPDELISELKSGIAEIAPR